MAHMPDLAREAAEAVFGHHHHDKETTMTTPQTQISTPAPQRNVLADLSYVLGQLDGNKLVSYLFGSGLGKLLTPEEIDHVIGIITSIEAARRPASGPGPAIAPAQ